MALRNQIAETNATYSKPLRGINLRDSEEALKPDEARLMENCEYFGGTRIRRGSILLGSGTYGAFAGLGGHKYYFGGPNPQNQRLIAYNNRISVIDGTGLETILTSGMTAGKDTFFTTWPVTDKVYISNGSDTLRSYDGTTFMTVLGTNVPTPRTAVVPVIDRLLAITNNGIERTDPRNDAVWSANSSWATFRPIRPGLFTALHPYTMKGIDTFYTGALALQERAYYLITGTNFGNDVIAVTAPVGEDSAIKIIDPTVGTASPDSVCTVPGIGIFWFTSDLNVFWLPEGQLNGRYVGDKLQSTVGTPGLESTNKAALNKVWMTYFDHILMLGIPVGTNNYATTQFWMDMRSLRDFPQRGPVWYGPMTGQSVTKAWVENQQSDNAVFGLEGNSLVGVCAYQLRAPSHFSDAMGTTNTPISMAYQTYFADFGIPSREKYVQAVHLDLNGFSGSATIDLFDLNGTLASNIPIEPI